MTSIRRRRRTTVTREEILLAAREQAISRGWRRARIQDIAAAVGISRPTLYKEFPSKEDLGAALVLREVAQFLDDLDHALAATPVLEDAVEAGVLFALETASQGPFLAAVLTEDRRDLGNLLPTFTDGSTSAHPMMAARVSEMVLRRAPDLDPDNARFVGTMAARMTLSVLIDPSATFTTREVAARIARMCAAYLGR